MNCPKCKGPGELLQDEIDIGVGVQVHVIGFECPSCGQMAVCNDCGAWDFQPHGNWCGELGDPPYPSASEA